MNHELLELLAPTLPPNTEYKACLFGHRETKDSVDERLRWEAVEEFKRKVRKCLK